MLNETFSVIFKHRVRSQIKVSAIGDRRIEKERRRESYNFSSRHDIKDKLIIVFHRGVLFSLCTSFLLRSLFSSFS